MSKTIHVSIKFIFFAGRLLFGSAEFFLAVFPVRAYYQSLFPSRIDNTFLLVI